METSKDRILQYIDYQDISIRKFCEKNLLSHSILTKKGAIGSDKLETILKNNPQLNAEWLITGKGKMLSDILKDYPVTTGMSERELEKKMQGEIEVWEKKYYGLLEKYNKCLELNSYKNFQSFELNNPETKSYKTQKKEK
jgi:hypothetical protein